MARYFDIPEGESATSHRYTIGRRDGCEKGVKRASS